MPTLISLLGKGKSDPKTGYRKARYRFEDGNIHEEPFFGLALAQQIKPKRLVVAGTAGSMWDVLLHHQGAGDDTVLQLMALAEQEAITQELLKTCEPHLSQQLGLPVTCLLIPYAKNEGEQVAILQALASTLTQGERVVIDVTHGFRHLPMLALVAARYLARVQQVQVQEVYYGALEMTPQQGETPVLKLGSMLQMLDWVESLASYEKDGDYGVFAPLLQRDGMDKQQTELLKKAAFFERTSNPVQARQKLGSVFEALSNHTGALAQLFRDTLTRRISWFRKGNRADWEQSLADAYLERGDYLRAATYLYESYITRATLERGWDSNNFNDRKQAYELERTDDTRELEFIRNSMAHGLRPMDKHSTQNLKNQEALEKCLRRLRDSLKH